MARYSEVIINEDKSVRALMKVDFKFRKDQNFDSDYIVAYNYRYDKAYLLKRILDNKFKVDKLYSSGPGWWSIKSFVNGDIDVYWAKDILYDKNHKVIFKLPKWIAEMLQFYYSYEHGNLIFTHLKEDIYISTRNKESVILISQRKKVLFRPSRYNNSTKVCATCEMIYLDDIAFEDFQITKDLLEKLKQLETVDQMKELILKELTINVI
jgi:hypothetical protein